MVLSEGILTLLRLGCIYNFRFPEEEKKSESIFVSTQRLPELLPPTPLPHWIQKHKSLVKFL